MVLARDHLDLDPSGYGLLLGAIGIGAVLGPFLLTRLVSDPRRPLFVFGPYVLRGVVDIALAIFTALPVALVVYGLGTFTGAATFNSLLQAHVPEHARGRIFASFDVLWQLGRLISLLLGGLVTAWLGIQSVYYLGGGLLLLAAGLGWSGLRSPSPTSNPA